MLLKVNFKNKYKKYFKSVLFKFKKNNILNSSSKLKKNIKKIDLLGKKIFNDFKLSKKKKTIFKLFKKSTYL